MSSDDEPDEMLDDVITLWRAFEVTWSDLGTENEQAAAAVVETIANHGIKTLPATLAFVESLRAFQHASPLTCAEWFSASGESTTETKTSVVRTIKRLHETAARPSLWTAEESKKLARLLYRIRGAVVHASLETDNSLAGSVLPPLREALVELNIARIATRCGVTLEEATQHFEAAHTDPRVTE